MTVNIGSSNGLVPSGNKPLPEPVLSKIICCHQATMSYFFINDCLDTFETRKKMANI